MNAYLEQPGTVIPTVEDAELAATASRAIARASKEVVHVRIGDSGEDLELPKSVTQFLSHILTEMSQGNAVTVIPIHAEMTTQEAADFLNVSRPHLVSLIQSGQIAHHMVGTHRRVRFQDVCEYKAQFDAKRSEAMIELAAQGQELGFGY